MLRKFRMSVRLSHACIVSKRLNISPKFFHYLIGPSLYFFVAKGCCVNLTASPTTGAPNTRDSDFWPICGYISETVLDRGIVTTYYGRRVKVVCALSNSAAFDDLEWPEPLFQGHMSQCSLKANVSQTVHQIHHVFGSSSPGFSGSADRIWHPVR